MNIKITVIAYASVVPFIVVNHITQAVITLAPHDREIDFDDDIVEAKKWGKKWNIAQEKIMNRDDHRAFSIFSRNWSQINRYLREEKSNFITNETVLATKGYPLKINEMITTFDKTLDKLPLRQTLHVYRRVDEKFFDIDANLRIGKKINVDLAKRIMEKYTNKIFKEHSYTSTSLSSNPIGSFFTKNTFPILMKIKLSEKIKGIYLGEISEHPEELEFLVKRGYDFKYEKFSIINEKEHQTLKMEISIVDN